MQTYLFRRNEYAKKKIQRYNGIRIHDLRDTGAMQSTNRALSYEATSKPNLQP